MSWASSRFPSTNHRVLTSSARRAVNVRNRRSAEVSSTDAPAFVRSHTLMAGLPIPSPLQTRNVQRRIAAIGKNVAFSVQPAAGGNKEETVPRRGRAFLAASAAQCAYSQFEYPARKRKPL